MLNGAPSFRLQIEFPRTVEKLDAGTSPENDKISVVYYTRSMKRTTKRPFLAFDLDAIQSVDTCAGKRIAGRWRLYFARLVTCHCRYCSRRR